jgi:hypothetical protein
MSKNNKNIKIRNDAIINNYINQTKNKPNLLPTTEIIDYIKNNYNNFIKEKEQNIIAGKDEIELSSIFSIPPGLNLPEKIVNINTNFKQNPEMSLDKLLAYSLWFKSPDWFQNLNNVVKFNIEYLKYQIGKDINRIPIKVNNNTFSLINTEDYYKTTDNFNVFIMKTLANNQVLIKQNTILKLDILMCQNLYNFISQTISLFIINKISPEYATETQATKDIQIFLNNNQQYVVFNFQCKLIISYKQELNPEFTCGSYSFSLRIDLKKNTFSLNNFILNYNVDDCNPKKNLASETESDVQIGKSFLKKSANFLKNNKATIAAGLATSGLLTVGALYLAGVLGGKKTKKSKSKKLQRNHKNKKNRTKRKINKKNN